jgi:hypothetical protein
VSTSPRPAWFRVARAFRIAALLALVLIIVYVGIAVYSATRLRGGSGGGNGNPATTTVQANDSVLYQTSVNLTNPGWVPINSIQVTAEVLLPGGPVIARGGSPSISIGPGETRTIPVSFLLPPLSATGPMAMLVTHDAELPLSIWVNVTYASLFGVVVSNDNNYSWGAPFDALNGSMGTPTLQGNGSVQLPITLSFQNHAKFSDVGTLSASIRSSSGQVCADPSFVLNVPGGGSYDQTQDLYLTGGCDPSGGSLVLTYHGPQFDLTLPAEAIP